MKTKRPSESTARKSPQAQASQVTFSLHTLGWKAFQDLCATILAEVFGQTIEVFLPAKDGGRDGAFNGVWKSSDGISLSGSFTLQCKFTSKADASLSLADLKDEFAKAKRLGAKGIANNYILMTNFGISGTTEEALREAFLSSKGINSFLALGRDWVTLKIRESQRLRMLVPRVYGLGDLSQILDERQYLQAQEILSSMGEDLSKLVVTHAYQQSAKAILEKGFVLLLGEPAAGKSTIAAGLSLGALDNWNCSTLKDRNAGEFVEHWNPNEKQFFWIDDAFGPNQYQPELAREWNGAFSHLNAAIRKGSRILFTSRDYIFKSALRDLKLTAFPLLQDSQVIINVQDLKLQEKEQILYNHLKLGTQPRTFKTAIKPYLQDVATNPRFLPEIARRLADPLFTRHLSIGRDSVRKFVEHPVDFLIDVIRSLDKESKAAIAVIFMGGGSLMSPVDFTPNVLEALNLLGGSVSGVREALNSLDGSLVKLTKSAGIQRWTYKHPTVGDAFGAVVARDPELLAIYLTGAKIDQLIAEVVCGDVEIEGAHVFIPPKLYDRFAAKLVTLNKRIIFTFLATRCDASFLKQYVASAETLWKELLIFWSNLSDSPEIALAAKLQEFDLLPSSVKDELKNKAIELAVELPDADFLDKESMHGLFYEVEINEILEAVKTQLLPQLDDVVRGYDSNYDRSSNDPDSYYGPLIDTLQKLQERLQGDKDIAASLARALDRVYSDLDCQLQELPQEPEPDYDSYGSGGGSTPVSSFRSIFDDIDQ
jgi:hypothetical protein